MQHGGTVIQLAFHRKRQAGDGGEGELRTDRKQRLQRGKGALLQGGLEQQIPAGIAGQAQLRQDEQMRPGRSGLLHHLGGVFGIVAAIRHPQGGTGGGDFDKSVFHGDIRQRGLPPPWQRFGWGKGGPQGRRGAAPAWAAKPPKTARRAVCPAGRGLRQPRAL